MKIPSAYTNDELSALHQRGVAAREFYENNTFYRKFIEPALIEQAQLVRKQARWTPQGAKPAATSGELGIYASGYEDGALYCEDFIARCISEGKVAFDEMQRRAKAGDKPGQKADK